MFQYQVVLYVVDVIRGTGKGKSGRRSRCNNPWIFWGDAALTLLLLTAMASATVRSHGL
jgi:hypothetical protein